MATEFSFEEATAPVQEFSFEEATAPQLPVGPMNDQESMLEVIRSSAVPVGQAPPAADLESAFMRREMARPAEFRSAPEESLLSQVTGAVREKLSPILGPTERARMEAAAAGFDRVKPLGGRMDQEGLLAALSTPNPDYPLQLPIVGQQENPVAQAAAGVYNPVAGAVNSVVATPLGLVTGGLGAEFAALKSGVGAARGTAAVFGADMARNLPEQIRESAKVLTDPNSTLQQQLEAIGNPAIAAAFTAVIGKEATAGLRQKIRDGVDVRREIAEVLRATEAPVDPAVVDAQARASMRPDTVAERTDLRPSPEVTETASLMDQALKERSQLIERPGEPSALARLRARPGNDILAGERLTTDVIQAPELPSAVRQDIEGGRVSFRRGAEETASIAQETPVVERPAPVPVAETPRVDYSAEVQRARTPQELADVFKSRETSLTQEAYRLGETLDTQAKLDQVNALAAKAKEEVNAALTAGDFDRASVHAMQGQFYREASEFATGTGSAGAYQQKNLPDFQPPLKAKAEAAPKPKNLLEDWADNVIKDAGKSFNTLVDPRLAAAAIVKGSFIIGRGVKKFADWSAEMIREFGEKIRPDLEEIYGKAIKFSEGPVFERSVETGETKIRKSIDRAIRSEEIPQAARDLLAADPDSRYNVQRVQPKAGQPSVSDLVSKMPVSELEAVDVRSNIYVASKIELAKRLMREGDVEGGYQVFKRLAQEGTAFGQNIYQFTLLKDVDPTAVSRIVDRQLVERGYDPLSKDQQKAITKKSNDSIEANEAAQAAKDKWLKDPTDANAEAVDAASATAKELALELQKEILKHQPKTLPQILKAVIQGNLLTPLSQSANLIGNMTFMPFRAGAEATAAGVNALDSFIRNKPREIEFNPVRQAEAAARGVAEGVKTIPDILKKGAGEVNQGERFRGLQPLRAWANLLSKNPEVPTVGGKIPLSDRVGMVIEGTFGVPAEAMLRGLAAGDAPFRGKAHAQAVEKQLSLAKIPESDLPMARKYPELFLDRAQMDAIYKDTTSAIFQQPSGTVTALNRWIRQTGGDWLDLGLTTIAPYRLTPWNLIGEIFSYHPLIATAQAAFQAKKGNTAGAQRAAAKAVVGSVLTYAGWWLYQKGLLSPSLDDTDEQQKGRLAAQAVMPPNHVNMSGLERALKGEDPTFRSGDTTVDTSRLGLAGAVFYTTANLGREFERDPKSSSENVGEWMKNSIMEEAKYGLNQSFLKGTATALEAIKSGKGDDFIRGLENTVLAVPIPNTIPAISRATSPNKVEVKDDRFLTQLDNIIQEKLRILGAGKDLPVKRGIWGEPLPETPEGSNPYAYHFFDITRSRSVPPDPAALEVYRLWRKSGDTSVIPTPPGKTLTHNRQTYELTTAQQSELQRLVGPLRKERVNRLTENPNFMEAPDEVKIRLLKRAYDVGGRLGQLQFLQKELPNLKVKAKRPGFTPE